MENLPKNVFSIEMKGFGVPQKLTSIKNISVDTGVSVQMDVPLWITKQPQLYLQVKQHFLKNLLHGEVSSFHLQQKWIYKQAFQNV